MFTIFNKSSNNINMQTLIIDSRANDGKLKCYVNASKIYKLGVKSINGVINTINMNSSNNSVKILIGDESKCYQFTFPEGNYYKQTYLETLKKLLNKNPYQCNFSIRIIEESDKFKIVSNSKFKFIDITNEHRYTFGLRNMTEFDDSYEFYYYDLLFSPTVYLTNNYMVTSQTKSSFLNNCIYKINRNVEDIKVDQSESNIIWHTLDTKQQNVELIFDLSTDFGKPLTHFLDPSSYLILELIIILND